MFASRLGLVLLGLALVLSGFSIGRAESQDVRLAVVALPGEQSVPPVLVDLVELQLANAKHLTLLERMRIDAVLEERGLTQALGTQAIVELGALLRADALLLLTAEDRAGTDIVIRFRLLDAHDGLKLADGTAFLPSAAGAYDAVATTVAGRTVRGLASRIPDEAATPIAVLGFTSENVSRRFDWVAGVLAAGLEEQLVGCAGLVVLERERLQALVDVLAIL